MDRVATSKVGLQYWIRIPALIISIGYFAWLIIGRRDSGDNPELAFITNGLMLFSLFVIVVVIIVLGFLLSPQKITISGYGILMHGNMMKRQLVITKGDVQKIYVTRTKKSARVSASDRTLCIDLKNGKEVEISEASYENFESLKYAIYEYLEYINANSETAL
ncbi:hypothetical protein SAMN05216490_1645 [Mucilaginibacter mallensis]|uniref:PH domain-containing protein n=1 Tax=Mucilaginibacter mallensis TaxID=652787 RepID=A0A1H1UEU5_MUCMA|nr:hypothetical protein [Mucilaginibacter mallensis]SDS70399.1 hypothetical protein SAMN05216490_1645 [Mucilaginibacter mallensis]